MKDAVWLIAFVLTLGVGAIAAHEAGATADQEDTEAIASRDFAAQRSCNGQPFEWLDDKTVVCYREVRP